MKWPASRTIWFMMPENFNIGHANVQVQFQSWIQLKYGSKNLSMCVNTLLSSMTLTLNNSCVTIKKNIIKTLSLNLEWTRVYITYKV